MLEILRQGSHAVVRGASEQLKRHLVVMAECFVPLLDDTSVFPAVALPWLSNSSRSSCCAVVVASPETRWLFPLPALSPLTNKLIP